MEILLCNDDGYYSKGIKELELALLDIANLTIVAPETNCSGASSSLTIKNPLRIRKFQENGYFVNGTPCDCIHLAATTICDKRPELILSGINLGANLGDDVLYSGTVGAAMGGRFIDVPCLALSIVDRKPVYLNTAVEVALNLVKFLSVSNIFIVTPITSKPSLASNAAATEESTPPDIATTILFLLFLSAITDFNYLSFKFILK